MVGEAAEAAAAASFRAAAITSPAPENRLGLSTAGVVGAVRAKPLFFDDSSEPASATRKADTHACTDFESGTTDVCHACCGGGGGIVHALGLG